MIGRNTLSVPLVVLALVAIGGADRWAKAGGGEVMPASAQPLGFSLAKAAAATAAFNTGPRTTAPDVPFQVLYVPNAPPFPADNTFVVKQGTHFYVPALALDDSPPVIGDFPADVSDQQSDADYVFDENEIGASLAIEVDGRVTELNASDVAGTTTDPLPDGGGTHYIAAGVFLTPMSKGTHIVKVSGVISGAAWQALAGGPTEFEFTYTVIVK